MNGMNEMKRYIDIYLVPGMSVMTWNVNGLNIQTSGQRFSD